MSQKPKYIHGLVCVMIALSLSLSNCKKDDGGSSPQRTASVTFAVDPATTFQTISGFGGANQMWGTQFMEPAEISAAFGTGVNDLGLSIFRVRISSNSQEWPLILESAQAAQSHGAKILASPWSPPAALKSNDSDVGGFLPPENYEAFKNHINAFIQYMADNDVDIHAVSVQNEPDIEVSYESCDWSSAQMGNFIAEYGGQIQGAQLAAPESFNFSQNFTNDLLNNTAVASNIDIVAGHIYGGGLQAFPLAAQQNKEVWMTEYLLNLNTGNSGAPAWTTYSEDDKWEETLDMLVSIHESMSLNWNAYIWWYIQRYYSFIGDGDQGTSDGEILKRGIAFSHFSKFVRPGYVRIDAQSDKSTEVKMTAYDSGDKIVVVAINTLGTGAGNVQFSVPSISGAEAYISSNSLSMESPELDILDDGVLVNVPPRSVVTILIDK